MIILLLPIIMAFAAAATPRFAGYFISPPLPFRCHAAFIVFIDISLFSATLMIISPPLSFIIFDFSAFHFRYFDSLSRRRQIAPPPPAFLTAISRH
jgi:hypothetical protein